MKLIGKSVLKFFLIAGGVTVAIVFPSTIVIAVLGGMVAFLDGRAIKSIKKFRENQKKRKPGKDDLKGVETEITKKKIVREYLQQQAPPLYPRAQKKISYTSLYMEFTNEGQYQVVFSFYCHLQQHVLLLLA